MRSLLNSEIYYDIIISDFGRNAAVNYLKFLEFYERQKILEVFGDNQLEFFDEYRRIMFNVIADINFLKNSEIQVLSEKYGILTGEILFGVGETKMSKSFFDKLFIRIILALQPALLAGYKNIRISIICNSLSLSIEQIVSIIKSEESLYSYLKRLELPLDISKKISSKNISARTVPKGVLATLVNDRQPILIIGVRNAVEYYRSIFSNSQARIIELDNDDYLLIDKAVVAAISNKKESIFIIKKKLQEEIIEKYQHIYGDIIIVEACTDFDFQIGENSLKLFAKYMVDEAYKFSI